MLVIYSRAYSVFSLFLRYCLCVLVIHYISSLFISCASRNLVINNEAFNVVHGCLMSFRVSFHTCVCVDVCVCVRERLSVCCVPVLRVVFLYVLRTCVMRFLEVRRPSQE